MKNVRIPLNMYLQKKNIFTLQEQADETKMFFNKLESAKRSETSIKRYDSATSINTNYDVYGYHPYADNKMPTIPQLQDTFVYHGTLSTELVSRKFIIYDRRIY